MAEIRTPNSDHSGDSERREIHRRHRDSRKEFREEDNRGRDQDRDRHTERERTRDRQPATPVDQRTPLERRHNSASKATSNPNQVRGNGDTTRTYNPKGRGKNNEMVDMHEVAEALRNHRKQLLRLDAERRSSAKEQNFIVEFQENERTVRESLERITKQWQDTRPERGGHPAGAIHSSLVKEFAKCVCNEIRDLGDDFHDSGWHKQMHKLANSTEEYVSRFHPIGNRKKRFDPTKKSIWILRFESHSTSQREFHSWVYEHLSDWPLRTIQLRQDRAPIDELTRETGRLQL